MFFFKQVVLKFGNCFVLVDYCTPCICKRIGLKEWNVHNVAVFISLWPTLSAARASRRWWSGWPIQQTSATIVRQPQQPSCKSGHGSHASTPLLFFFIWHSHWEIVFSHWHLMTCRMWLLLTLSTKRHIHHLRTVSLHKLNKLFNICN